MPATFDKLLGKPLLHSHQGGDIKETTVVVPPGSTTVGTETVILVDASSGAQTISLPLASSAVDKVYKIKKTDSSANTVTVDGNAAETIDGDATKILAYPDSAMQIVSNGTSWYIT